MASFVSKFNIGDKVSFSFDAEDTKTKNGQITAVKFLPLAVSYDVLDLEEGYVQSVRETFVSAPQIN